MNMFSAIKEEIKKGDRLFYNRNKNRNVKNDCEVEVLDVRRESDGKGKSMIEYELQALNDRNNKNISEHPSEHQFFYGEPLNGSPKSLHLYRKR